MFRARILRKFWHLWYQTGCTLDLVRFSHGWAEAWPYASLKLNS